ncbi:MAG: diguanylate cyclase, partial [Odoribacter sp.]|nr:diguanylate cyclase [Odoribacter sp.]
MDLRTKFVGLELKSPVIAGSCGLTADLNKIQEMAKHGAGAVILKSVFEEQMNREASQCIEDSYPEETDYIQTYVRAH